MLQKIRDNTQGLIAKIFIGFIIAVFALFGVESIVGTLINATPALEVNGEEINSLEIDNLSQRKAQEFFAGLDEGADVSDVDDAMFRESAVNELIQRTLLKQSAAASGMAVSAASVDRRILQTEDFQVDGVYNDERANILLSSIGLSPAGYRTSLSQEMLLNQILAAYSASGFVTNQELAQLAALVHQKRSFRYVGLSLDSQGSDVAISDEDVTAYYEANQDQFQREEQVKIAWLELDKQKLLDEISVSEEQVRARYDEEVATFQAQTERRAAHILFEISEDAASDAVLEEAASIKVRLDAGEDFAALAAEFSDDAGSAQDGGDVGYTTGDSFVPEFEEALRALEVGQVSGPVRTEFGVHLIKLLEVNATEAEPYETRRDALERDLKSTEVDTLFIARSEELGNLAFESVGLEEPAATMGLELQQSEWFGRSGGAAVTAVRGVIDAAFSREILEERLNSELIQVDANRSVVIQVLDHQLPATRPLEEVQDEIVVTLRLQRMQEQARQIGETIISSLQTGANIDSLLEAQGVTWTNHELVERGSTEVNPMLLERIFAMDPPAKGSVTIAGFQLPGGEYAVVELQAVVPGSNADLQGDEESSMRSFLSQQTAALDFAGYFFSLENRAEIVGRDQAPAEGEFEDF
ncbi:MAG: SurA N-terminal domain-containing protein [Pseudohongiellaceae bacterium]